MMLSGFLLVCCAMLAWALYTHLFLFLPLHWTEKVFADKVPRCVECDGIVKPGECSTPHTCPTAGSRTICTSCHECHLYIMPLSCSCHILVMCMSRVWRALVMDSHCTYLLLVHTFDYLFAIRHCLLWRESSRSVRQTPRAGTVGLDSLTAQHINILRMLPHLTISLQWSPSCDTPHHVYVLHHILLRPNSLN